MFSARLGEQWWTGLLVLCAHTLLVSHAVLLNIWMVAASASTLHAQLRLHYERKVQRESPPESADHINLRAFHPNHF